VRSRRAREVEVPPDRRCCSAVNEALHPRVLAVDGSKRPVPTSRCPGLVLVNSSSSARPAAAGALVDRRAANRSARSRPDAGCPYRDGAGRDADNGRASARASEPSAADDEERGRSTSTSGEATASSQFAL